MANPIPTAIGRVQPLYKGSYDQHINYDKLDNVILNGNSYVSLQTNNIGNIPSADSSYWQLIASKGDTGDIGSITVTAFPSDTAYASASATGSASAKDLSFSFGLPKGDTGDPGGFASAIASVNSLGVHDSAYASASISGPSSAATLNLTFGIPIGSGQVDSVDGFSPSGGNVPLTAVQFASVQDANFYISKFGVSSAEVEEVMSTYQARARANINAQVAGDYIASPSAKTVDQFLKYAGNNIWATASVDAFPAGGSSGDFLRKTNSGTEWSPVHEVIASGAAGAVLTKASATNYDLTWSNPISNSEIDALFE